MIEIWQATRLALAGAFVFLLAIECWLYASRRRRVHMLGAIISGLVAAFLLARWANHEPFDESSIRLAAQIQYAVLVLFGATAAQIIGEVSDRARRVGRALGVAGLALAALVFVDGPILSHELVMMPGPHPALTARVTSTAPLLLGPFVLAFVILVAVERRGTRLLAIQFRIVKLFGVLIPLAVLNDVLRAAGLLETPEVLDLVLAGLGLGLAAVMANHAERRYELMREDVLASNREVTETSAALDHLLTHLPDIVFVYWPERGLELFSEQAHGHWRVDHGELIDPRRITKDHEQLVARLSSVEPKGPAKYFRISLQSDDDNAFPAEVVAMSVELGGAPAVVAAARDLSERTRLEQQLRLADRLSSVGTLAAGVAHEINNPLTYVTSNISFVRDALNVAPEERDEDEMRAALDDASAGADRVANIVRELGQFGRSETSDPLMATDLLQPLRFALDLASHRLRHHCTVVRRWSDDEPITVYGEEGRLSQVFVNLLTNAVDAMPEDRPANKNSIVVEVTEDQEFVEVVVRDNGTGMTPAQLEHVFDPFFTTKGVAQGMGLGLSICHSIVSEIGGELTFESEVGRGTIARVRLRRSSPVSEASDPRVPERGHGMVATVLIIDDEPAVSRALERSLQRDFAVVCVASGDQALAVLSESAPDVIICDLMMPGMSGADVLATIREERPELVDRFVLLTGGAVGSAEEKFLAESGVPVIRKPFASGEVEAVVRNLLTSAALSVSHL